MNVYEVVLVHYPDTNGDRHVDKVTTVADDMEDAVHKALDKTGTPIDDSIIDEVQVRPFAINEPCYILTIVSKGELTLYPGTEGGNC